MSPIDDAAAQTSAGSAARSALARALGQDGNESGGFFLERFLGCSLRLEAESAEVSFDIEPFMLNSGGTLHGGVIAFVLDSAAGSLFKRFQGPGYTLEGKTQYLRALSAGRATCNARFLRRGRLVSFIESRLLMEDGKVAAISTSTWHTA